MGDPRARLLTGESAARFILSGKARITLVSQRTGARFTYRIASPSKGADAIHFVSLLSGSDNESDYTFLGTIFGASTYRHGRRSSVGSDTPSARAFEWAWSHLAKQVLPGQLEIWHEGRCGACGRVLTVPDSIENGLGPICAQGLRNPCQLHEDCRANTLLGFACVARRYKGRDKACRHDYADGDVCRKCDQLEAAAQ